MSEIRQFFDRFVEKYHDDLVAFAKDLFDVEFDRNQLPIAIAIQEGRRRIAVKSGHGVGKTTVLGIAACWFACTRFPMKVVVTAPSAKQLWDALWPEVRSRFRQLPSFLQDAFNVLAERIEHRQDPDQSFISPATSTKENPESIAGKHSANVLLLCDESSGIPDEVFDAGSGSMSGHNAQTVLTGNPVRLSGFFYRVFNDPDIAADWSLHTISAEDSAFVARDFIHQFEKMHGRDSNAFRVRVLGEFPLSDDESYIGEKLIIAAMDREIIKPPFRPIWGLDPARMGKDRTAFAEKFGAWFGPIESWAGQDTMKTVGAIVRRYRESLPGQEPSQILVDVIGIGAGVVDRLAEQGLPVVGVNVSELPAMESSMCDKLRDELWWKWHQDLYAGRVRHAKSETLKKQACQPKYEYRSDGALMIESKKAMRKRGLGSPDEADAVCLTYAGDAAIAIGAPVNSWGGAFKSRKIAVA